MLKNIVCAYTLLIATDVFSASFSVQLDASKNSTPGNYTNLSEYGRVYTLPTSDDGLTRTRLGSFSSEEEARSILTHVRKSGHADAFLVQDKIDPASIEKSTDIRSTPTWSSLTEEQRSNIVYLDGVLHIKNGDTFTPVSELLKE